MINGSNVNECRALAVHRDREMAVRDALPPSLRKLLGETAINYAVTPIGQMLVDGVPPAVVAAEILASDRAVRSARDQAARRAWQGRRAHAA